MEVQLGGFRIRMADHFRNVGSRNPQALAIGTKRVAEIVVRMAADFARAEYP